MDDFGIDDELPSNPFVFILQAGTHHKYLGRLLVFSPNKDPAPGKRFPIHNAKGVFHEVKISTTGRLKLGPRRKDIKAHNVYPPDQWTQPQASTPPPFSPHVQFIVDRAREIAARQAPQPEQTFEEETPRPDTPEVSAPSSSNATTNPSDDPVIRLAPIPSYLRNSPVSPPPVPTMSNTQTQGAPVATINFAGIPCTPGGTPIQASGPPPGGNPGGMPGGGTPGGGGNPGEEVTQEEEETQEEVRQDKEMPPRD